MWLLQYCEYIGRLYCWDWILAGQEVVWDMVDLVGQATEIVVVVVEPFVVVWVMVNKSFEGDNLVQQGKENSPAKVVVETRAARALECSTSDSRHKENENAGVTYL